MNSQETGIAIGVAIFYIVYVLLFTGISLASYIMSSLAFFRIAKNRGIRSAWLAWVPVAKVWTQGRIAQEYDSRMIGIKRKWNVYLLVLNLVVYAAFFIMYAVLIVFALSNYVGTYGTGSEGYSTMDTGAILAVVLPVYGLMFVVAFLGIALNICNYISLYKVFESTVPEKSLKYMILSIMVPLALPICLLKCSNRAFNEVGTNFLWKSGDIATETVAVVEAPQTQIVAEGSDSSAE